MLILKESADFYGGALMRYQNDWPDFVHLLSLLSVFISRFVAVVAWSYNIINSCPFR